jgi:amino acid transporter
MTIVTLCAAIAFYVLVQAAFATGGQSGVSAGAPLVIFADELMGAAGRLMIIGAALVSIFGNLLGSMAVTPRLTFALARDGLLPRQLASVSPRFATPSISIALAAAFAAFLAITGSFVSLAVVATLARLSVYLATIVTLPIIRRRIGSPRSKAFVASMRIGVYGIAVAVCLLVIGRAPFEAWVVLSALALAGAVLHLLTKAPSPSVGAE